MNNEEEKRCPLCAEEMDWTDQQLNPCKCGYEVCVWCWHHIMDMAEKDATEGRCPACRTPYDKDRIVGLEANFQRVAANCASRKQKLPKAKPKPNEGRKDLSNVRVIQRRMAYIIGLPLDLADEELLQRKDYFGQYGKVTKVSLSRTAGGAVQQFINDTCSVYITYSKEEEAVRCIQSVHGYVLDGRLLRASFGTAKYCHAWLRNMPCNNPACLYLHTVGAEEDSFGKDEVAAVHTRNRVQEIVGATQYLHRRSGSMLPPPVVEQLNNHSATAEEPLCNNGLKDVAYAPVASGDHLSCSKEKDGSIRSCKQMATFVDIVGRSCNSGSNKDVNSDEEERILNLFSDSDRVETECSDSMLLKSPAPSQFDNAASRSKLYGEPFREASKLLSVERSNSSLDETCITKEQFGLPMDSGRQVLHSPFNTTTEDSLTFDDQRSKNSFRSSHKVSLLPSYPAETTKNCSDNSWWHTDYHNQISAEPVHSYADQEDRIPSPYISSVLLNDGYNEKKFQSSAKSDRIYRCSNSFSNEEIVEHLRRLDHETLVNNDENSAAVESSIISDILAMDLDGSDNSAFPQTVAGLFEARDGRHGSLRNFQNNDQSRFSFANKHGFSGQQNDLGSPSSNIGQELNFPVLQDSCENKDHLYKSQHHASRAPNSMPPGFSMPSKPPPGFSAACLRTEQAIAASSGRYVRTGYHYRSPSLGNLSNSSDDLVDPATTVGGGKSSTNGLTNSWTSSFSSRCSSSFDEDTKHWSFMQQQSAAATAIHHEPQFSQASMQQQQQHHTPQQQFPSHDDFGSGLTSGLMDLHHQSYDPSLFTQQPKFGNGYHQHNQLQLQLQLQLQQEGQQHAPRSEVERGFGFESLLPGYGDYMFQMPTSGDVYTRVFGM
ncbi:uncharacterized protein LOC112525527 isoform X1 [Cynara cardunculus var. scolymus]|uniref:uncharacterized protein LOC112525527 isoform X1 n=1 Tax=Cynara cardunculus var. scolymus TaxID=59895 RepID=UPI000D62AA5A|nr:uncharacterized protein LOC112525527 isoform X1 [Cynara cardunculus var. scolymus]